MSTPINLGILGAGLAVEHLHWPALQSATAPYSIVAVCDSQRTAAQHIADLTGQNPSVTTHWAEFFATPHLEAVLVSLPIHLNADGLKACIQAGKHVICEKPLAANLEQAQSLTSQWSDSPLTIVIAENFHYREDLKQARRWMDEGQIGEPILLSIRSTFWADTTQGFSATRWRQDPQYRGSVVADAAVHHAAALHEIGGSIERLQAFTRDVHPVLAGIDTLSLNVRFESGLLGHVLFSAAVQPKDPTFDHVTILGTKGSITVERGVATLTKPDHDAQVFTAEDAQGYSGEFTNFYRAIRYNEPVVATLEQACKDWTIIMHALDSAEGSDVVRC